MRWTSWWPVRGEVFRLWFPPSFRRRRFPSTGKSSGIRLWKWVVKDQTLHSVGPFFPGSKIDLLVIINLTGDRYYANAVNIYQVILLSLWKLLEKLVIKNGVPHVVACDVLYYAFQLFVQHLCLFRWLCAQWGNFFIAAFILRWIVQSFDFPYVFRSLFVRVSSGLYGYLICTQEKYNHTNQSIRPKQR